MLKHFLFKISTGKRHDNHQIIFEYSSLPPNAIKYLDKLIRTQYMLLLMITVILQYDTSIFIVITIF